MSRIPELAGAVEIVVDFCVDFCLGHNAEIFFGHSPFTQIFALEETLTAFSFQLLVSVTPVPRTRDQSVLTLGSKLIPPGLGQAENPGRIGPFLLGFGYDDCYRC
jgi:hypothetical protein